MTGHWRNLANRASSGLNVPGMYGLFGLRCHVIAPKSHGALWRERRLRNRGMATNFTSANAQYANSFNKGSLALPPAKKLIVVTCMDARIDPAASLGLSEGDAHIIRNAGGSAKEAIRSVIISQRLLGTREIAVFHHTDCGMLTFNNDVLRGKLKESHPEQSAEIDKIDFLAFPHLEQSVHDDVKFLKDHALVLDESVITGWVYDVKTGKVQKVV